MKKRFFLIAGAGLFLVLLLLSLYFRSERFRQFYDQKLRARYLAEVYKGNEEGEFNWYGGGSFEDCVQTWDMCAIVKVTEGMEESLGADWKGEPNTIWDATYSNIEVEVEEYLYDKTENYFERLTIRAQPWRDVWARVYAYSGERLFLFIDVVGSGLCQTSTVWGYIITDKDYLVPLTDHYSEAMNEYGGRKRKDYQKKVTKAWEEYDTKMNFEAVIYQNILEFCGKTD